MLTQRAARRTNCSSASIAAHPMTDRSPLIIHDDYIARVSESEREKTLVNHKAGIIHLYVRINRRAGDLFYPPLLVYSLGVPRYPLNFPLQRVYLHFAKRAASTYRLDFASSPRESKRSEEHTSELQSHA